MKAIQIGANETLKWEKTGDPGYSEHDVLVKVHAAGVNRADILQVKGLYPPPEGASWILGLEMAGEVLETGYQVTKWRKGDPVMALIPGGAYAEKVAVNEDLLLPMPPHWEFKQGAAVPEALFTAYYNLIELGRLVKGEKVLIHSGAGGVGSTAIQLAKYFQAEVIATTGSDEKVKFCRELGADQVINYRQTELEKSIKEWAPKGIQLVLDTVGDTDYARLHSNVLAFKGRWLLIGLLGGLKAEVNMAEILSKNLLLKGSTLRNQPYDVKRTLTKTIKNKVLDAYQKGNLVPCIDRVFPVSEASEAHHYLSKNQVKGKLILQITSKPAKV